MNAILKKIQKIGIVPVVVLNDAKDAEPLAKALCDGGLPLAEVTFRTEAAEESIRIMVKKYPNMLIGAGTVVTTDQVDRAVDAGAKFIVSPGLNPKIVAYCLEKGVPITPGVSNPSDIEAAIELGLEVVKFFPAEQLGGLKMIKAMAAPYTKMMFMPTGGINAKNLNDYLAFPKILACGGSWMVSGDLVKAGAFDKITELTKEAIKLMLGFEVKQLGVGCDGSKMLEAMYIPVTLEEECVVISTNSMMRAVAYLESQGIVADMNTTKYEEGRLVSVELKERAGQCNSHDSACFQSKVVLVEK